MRKKKIAIAGLAAVAAASAMIGGTWAVWTQQLTVRNEFMTAKYSTFLRESFQPEDAGNKLPGEQTEKKVWVANEGTFPVIAKITLSQSWVRPQELSVTTSRVQENGRGELLAEEKMLYPRGTVPAQFRTTDSEGEQWEYAAIWNFNSTPGEEVMILKESRTAVPGLRMKGLKEIESLKEAEGHWLLLSEKPDGFGRYSFYYMGLVPAVSGGKPGKTPLLLEGVTMNPSLETTVTGSHTYFIQDPTAESGFRKVTENLVNEKYGKNGGYDGCDYTLNVAMQTLQATDGALLSIIQGTSISEEEMEVRDYLVANVTGDGGEDHSGAVKKLLFEESQGRMTYQSYRAADGRRETGNWFMSFTNMVPGGRYKDKLEIENAGRRNYRVYMKALPVEGQKELLEKLLEKIRMKVTYGDAVIYDGNATGYRYLQEGEETENGGAVPLGLYRRGDQAEITVELELEEDIGLEYADLLTMIDWQFMVQEISEGGGSSGGGSGGGGGGGTASTVTTIAEGAVPLASEVIPDEGVPLATLIPEEEIPLAALLPKTGDTRPILLLGIIAAGSLMMAIYLAIQLKRE